MEGGARVGATAKRGSTITVDQTHVARVAARAVELAFAARDRGEASGELWCVASTSPLGPARGHQPDRSHDAQH